MIKKIAGRHPAKKSINEPLSYSGTRKEIKKALSTVRKLKKNTRLQIRQCLFHSL